MSAPRTAARALELLEAALAAAQSAPVGDRLAYDVLRDAVAESIGVLQSNAQPTCRRCGLPRVISDEHDRRCTWHSRNRLGS